MRWMAGSIGWSAVLLVCLGCVPGGGGGGGGDGDGDGADQGMEEEIPRELVPAEMASGDICERAIECGAYAPESAGLCPPTDGRYGLFVVDLARFSVCIAQTDCEDYAADVTGNVSRCLDLDINSFSCQGDAVRFCDRRGQCRVIDCVLGCEEFFNVGYETCGFDATVGYQRCQCGFF